MRYGIRSLAALALVALLVPVAAVAKDVRVEGPAVVTGAGHFGGELELALGDGQRPVRIDGRAGYIGVLDLAGDLKLRCGKGRLQQQETPKGTAYRCAGRRPGSLIVLGSHVAFRGFLTRYRIQLPAGASGSLHGRFERSGKHADARDDGEVPSLEELAAMLAAADG